MSASRVFPGGVIHGYGLDFGFATLAEHLRFQDAIRQGGHAEVSVLDGALAVFVGVAAERSVRERRAVELRELDGARELGLA